MISPFASSVLPASVLAGIPPLYSTEKVEDPPVVAKLFTPDGQWTWYVIEGSPVDADGCMIEGNDQGAADDYMLFALVDGVERELGYVSLTELRAIRGPSGLPIERDIYWTPMPLSKAKALP